MSNELKLKYKLGQIVRFKDEVERWVIVEIDTDDALIPYRVTLEADGTAIWCSENELSPWEPEQEVTQQTSFAKVGDLIETTVAVDGYFKKGDVGVVLGAGELNLFVDFSGHTSDYSDDGKWYVWHGAYKVLSPSQQPVVEEQPMIETQKEPPSMVISPKHYVLFPEQGIEVRHVNKAWMDKIDEEGEYVSHHEAAWLVQATQYIFRSPFKGSTIEDLNKAIQSLQYVVESMNARKASE